MPLILVSLFKNKVKSLLEQAVEENYIKAEDMKVLKEWRINPEIWGK